jgi:DNA-binding PadR family transcriptional regulator
MTQPPTLPELVLRILGDRERFGLDMVTTSGGLLHRGTVYLLLSEMEAAGLITSRDDPAPRRHPQMLPRRLYKRAVGWQAALEKLKASVRR